uniref:Phosphatidylglycerophosphatase and protein-tyrosine phosphatase 1 n=1 Tax=Heterorhabditis bacteriophora TaxID=37862 RepID=A0A1I7XMV7_HETBA
MLSSLVFYPSLGYNLLRNYIQTSKWAWYNRIDDSLIVGAIPFKSMKVELVEASIIKENVGGVVCCTEEFELKATFNAMRPEDWAAAGVEFHFVPMTDFFGTASRSQIHSAVEFIEGITARGKTVYVHCKAGRTRSATVATCYLMKSRNWLPNVAFEFLKSQRHQVLLRNAHWRTANEYRRFLDRS